MEKNSKKELPNKDKKDQPKLQKIRIRVIHQT
jgi:hypothetical protein